MGIISECINCGYRENHPCDSMGNFVSNNEGLFCIDCVRKALFFTFHKQVNSGK